MIKFAIKWFLIGILVTSTVLHYIETHKTTEVNSTEVTK